jgi:hypothetical protein
MRLNPGITRAVYAGLVAAGLSFGAAQAFASPAPVENRAPTCDPVICNRVCQAIGGFGGFCNSAGGCSCYIGTP